MCPLRVLRKSLSTFLPKNRVRRKTEAEARRDVHAGGSWWAPLRPLRLMLSSGHATPPAWVHVWLVLGMQSRLGSCLNVRGLGTTRVCMLGGSWWAPLRPLRLMPSSGHATPPSAWVGSPGCQWGANRLASAN